MKSKIPFIIKQRSLTIKIMVLIAFFTIMTYQSIWARNPIQTSALGSRYQAIQNMNNPTAQTLPEKSVFLGFTSYNNGGIQNKVLISIYDFFDIGVSFDIQRALGDKQAQFRAPGAIGKIKFTEGSRNFPIFVAIGYDAFYTDDFTIDKNISYNKINKNLEEIYFGPYMLITKPIYLFGFEQFVHFGWRMPVQPEYTPTNSALFIGMDIPLGENFHFLLELDRIYTDAKRFEFLLYNLGFRFKISHNFYLSFLTMSGKKRRTNRILSLQYMSRF